MTSLKERKEQQIENYRQIIISELSQKQELPYARNLFLKEISQKYKMDKNEKNSSNQVLDTFIIKGLVSLDIIDGEEYVTPEDLNIPIFKIKKKKDKPRKGKSRRHKQPVGGKPKDIVNGGDDEKTTDATDLIEVMQNRDGLAAGTGVDLAGGAARDNHAF